MEQLISVVVPVYNVEKYLQRCVKSIQTQSYKNLEIILVDDGSTDKSGEICEILSNDDERIIVIHKENGGLSDARNVGLASASGNFIVFVDSDDWIEQDTINFAYKKMVLSNADVVVWGYSADFVSEDEEIITSTKYALHGTCNRVTKEEVFSNLAAFGLYGYAWNKLYRRSVIENLNFKKGLSLVEDILFNSDVASVSCKIEFIDFIGTHYIQRTRETLGNKYYSNYIELKEMAADAMLNIMRMYSVSERDSTQIMDVFYINTVKSAIMMVANEKTIKSEKKVKMKQLLNNEKVQWIAKNISPSDWRVFVLFQMIRIKAVSILLVILRK